MYAPAAVVVPDPTVDHVVEVEGRRCTLTARATYPVPVLTETASLMTYASAPLAAEVDHPDTLVATPVIPVTLRDSVVADAAVLVAFTYSRKYHTPVLGTV